jgi:hypothetical protein
MLSLALAFALESQTFEFRPSRPDISLDAAQVSVWCFRREGRSFTKCDGFTINGVAQSEQSSYSFLDRTGPNRFRLSALKVEYAPAREAYACVTIHPLIDGIPNKVNALYYAEERDRYTMLSYCTVDAIPAWGWDNARVTWNRVPELGDFVQRLSHGLPVRLTQRELPTPLGASSFLSKALSRDALYRCGYASPMPDGRVPETGVEPIAIPIGVYQKWEFAPDRSYICKETKETNGRE